MNKTENELVENNIGLVHSCANRFRGRGIEYDDLFQAGCLGLVKASKSFDSEKGFAFSTYSVYIILGEIRKLFRDGGSVKISRTMKEKARNAINKKNELAVKLGREPSVSELAKEIGCDLSETAEIINSFSPVISIDSEDYKKSAVQSYSDSPENEISDNIALFQVIDTLDENDRLLIEYRYFKGLSQTVTAENLGITQVSVSRKEKKILEDIRKKMIL
ncbi:MAG: sigma-70 family RNA polymerase sigma factor [Clostridia bacterium]|nr:sigma-70 family RNA polymerase sigma factor [Clostridia bacterium]